MLSRVADSLYWMARYLERAEHAARVLEVQLHLMLDRGSVSMERRWARTLRCLGIPPGAAVLRDPYAAASAIAFDASNRCSIMASIGAARENARQVRELISSEMWEQINRVFHEARRAAGGGVDVALEFLPAVREGSHLFQGITDSTMSHEQGWQFIQVGRALERALLVTTLLETYYASLDWKRAHTADDPLEWIGVLKSATAFEAYCKKRGADPRPDWIAEFLMLDAAFPHAVRFSVDALTAAIEALGDRGRRTAEILRLTGRLRAALSYAQPGDLAGQRFLEFLADIHRQCAGADVSLRDAYIAYSVQEVLGA